MTTEFCRSTLTGGPSRAGPWVNRNHQTIPFVCSDRQRRLLQRRRGESDLVFRQGQFYEAGIYCGT